MKVLQVTAHYSPNVGGVETHLSDLVEVLQEKAWEVFVLCYRPLTTKAKWKLYERYRHVRVLRIPWVPGLFYLFVYHPLLEFLYLLPGLFLLMPFVLLYQRPKVVHAHGLVAGAVSVFWGKLFRKRVIISLHSIYHFPRQGLYRNFVTFLFLRTDVVLTLSQQSAQEVANLGIPKQKIQVFTYWIDQKLFQKIPDAKKELGFTDKFIVLFVGRLITEKGIKELLEAAENWDKHITLVIAGTGPLESMVTDAGGKNKNIMFVGKKGTTELPLYYSAADVFILPSICEEGFGRVIIEALSCGIPVVGSNRGGIPEALTKDVGYLIDVTPENIRRQIDYLYAHPKELQKKAQQAGIYARKYFSKQNIDVILDTYL